MKALSTISPASNVPADAIRVKNNYGEWIFYRKLNCYGSELGLWMIYHDGGTASMYYYAGERIRRTIERAMVEWHYRFAA